MTRSPRPSTYDDDFFAWTQEQADAIRRLPDLVAASVDKDHLAMEIEDLGRRDLREVHSLLARLIQHLIKMEVCPTSVALSHWWAEASHVQASARYAFSPSMRQLLDVSIIWRDGVRAAEKVLSETENRSRIKSDCPSISMTFFHPISRSIRRSTSLLPRNHDRPRVARRPARRSDDRVVTTMASRGLGRSRP